MTTPSPLVLWTIYDHPSDYPEHFVARRWEGETATSDVLFATSLDELRQLFELQGLSCLTRSPSDDSVIVENWL